MQELESSDTVLVWLEANNRIVGVEWFIFGSQFLELPNDIVEGHAIIVGSWPGDHSVETAAFFYPSVGDDYRGLVVRHENATELGGFLEVLEIQSSLRECIDASDNVPASSSESFHKVATDVVVGIEGKSTSHANAGSRLGVC
ncbi:MAG TPA: hypothetical protein VEK15_01145 [Vicinamibacteria bacterium]|nr:hypothetical protein [Vicinamibacteria bacterium]